MLRSVATGTSARTATCRALSTSPPYGPADVAPTSTDRSASSMTLMNPSLPALWIHPRAELGTWVRPVRTRSPAARACSSVRPTLPISGSVNVTLGHRPVVGWLAALAEDVAHHDAGLVHGHVRERALAGDVADRPHPVRRAHPAVGGYLVGRLIQADRRHAERGQVDPAPGGDEQPLGGYGAHAQVDGEPRRRRG